MAAARDVVWAANGKDDFISETAAWRRTTEGKDVANLRALPGYCFFLLLVFFTFQNAFV